MHHTDDSILPKNMAPLIITAALFGPEWLPGDADIPVTWDEQVQAAVDCYNAGATMLHVHVHTGSSSKNGSHAPFHWPAAFILSQAGADR
jgi:hypothetical protein